MISLSLAPAWTKVFHIPTSLCDANYPTAENAFNFIAHSRVAWRSFVSSSSLFQSRNRVKQKIYMKGVRLVFFYSAANFFLFRGLFLLDIIDASFFFPRLKKFSFLFLFPSEMRCIFMYIYTGSDTRRIMVVQNCTVHSP